MVRGMKRKVGIALAACLFAFPAPGSSPSLAAEPLADCIHITPSPNFKVDRTLYCIADVIVDDEWDVALQISEDRGASWRSLPTDGLNSLDAFMAVDMVVMPRETNDSDFGSVNDLYVRLVHGEDRGLYLSRDHGETWLLVDKVLGEPIIRQLSSYIDPSPVPVGWIVYPGASPGRVAPPAHVPVAGSPEIDESFVLPPGFPTEGSGLALGSSDTDPDDEMIWFSHFSVYRCEVTLSCNDKRFTFPDEMSVHGDYIDDRVVYFGAVTSPVATQGEEEEEPRRSLVWWSKDGAETITKWRSVNLLLRPFGDDGAFVQVVESGIRKGRYFLLMDSPDRLYRSEDAGETWERLRRLPSTDVGDLVVAGRRLFVRGTTEEGERAFCSMDQGRSWALSCRA